MPAEEHGAGAPVIESFAAPSSGELQDPGRGLTRIALGPVAATIATDAAMNALLGVGAGGAARLVPFHLGEPAAGEPLLPLGNTLAEGRDIFRSREFRTLTAQLVFVFEDAGAAPSRRRWSEAEAAGQIALVLRKMESYNEAGMGRRSSGPDQYFTRDYLEALFNHHRRVIPSPLLDQVANAIPGQAVPMSAVRLGHDLPPPTAVTLPPLPPTRDVRDDERPRLTGFDGAANGVPATPGFAALTERQSLSARTIPPGKVEQPLPTVHLMTDEEGTEGSIEPGEPGWALALDLLTHTDGLVKIIIDYLQDPANRHRFISSSNPEFVGRMDERGALVFWPANPAGDRAYALRLLAEYGRLCLSDVAGVQTLRQTLVSSISNAPEVRALAAAQLRGAPAPAAAAPSGLLRYWRAFQVRWGFGAPPIRRAADADREARTKIAEALLQRYEQRLAELPTAFPARGPAAYERIIDTLRETYGTLQ